MNNSIFNLIQKASDGRLERMLEKYAALNGLTIGSGEGAISKEDVLERLNRAEEFIFAQVTGKNFSGEEIKDLPLLPFQEALTTSDASILFPRVISEILQEPKEPTLFLSNVVADTLRLPDDAPLSIEFPTMDAYTAYEMAEGQEYTMQTFSWQQHMVSMRLRKIGVGATMTEEIIARSMWPVLQLNLRAMAAAINRKVENALYQAMVQRAHVVFDNELADTDYQTTGKSVVGSSLISNGSFSYNDLVKMFSIMLGKRYEATHFLAHPLAWPIFAQDPILKAQFYHGGQIGQGIWSRLPSFDQSANFPFAGGITYVPYYALPANTADTLTGALSSLGASLTTDVYLIDARNSLFLATRGDTEMDEMDDWFRDARMLKAKKYVGVSAKDGGKGMTKAANIRIVENQEPLLTMRTVSS